MSKPSRRRLAVPDVVQSEPGTAAAVVTPVIPCPLPPQLREDLIQSLARLMVIRLLCGAPLPAHVRAAGTPHFRPKPPAEHGSKFRPMS